MKAAIAFVSYGVPEEHTSGGTRSKLMSRYGLKVRVAQAPKDTEMIIDWRVVVEAGVGYLIMNGGGGAPVQEITGCRKSFRPVGRFHGCMN